MKRLSYIISWTFVIADFDRIKFLPKEIRIKGWSPAKKDSLLLLRRRVYQVLHSLRVNEKEKIRKNLSELEDEPDEEAINRLLDEASSQSDDNGEMLKTKALARSYLNPFY